MQKLKIACAFLCVTLLFYSETSAQLNFNKGYIITNEGDTIPGFLRDQTYKKLSRQVYFKSSRKAAVKTFTPKDIKGFGFNDGDLFESFGIEYTFISKEGELKEVKVNRFLNKIIDSKLSLYELMEDEKPLFVKKRDGKLQLLCVQETLVTEVQDENGAIQTPEPGGKYRDKDGQRLIERGGKFYQQERSYIAILKSEMSDCNKLRVDEDLPLRNPAIYDLVMRYNEYCAPEDYQRFLATQSKIPVGRFTAYANIPTPYYQKYGGVGGGIMIEVGGQKLSTNFGFEYVIGKKNAEDFNYRFAMVSSRLNYRPWGSGIFSPYVFSGVSMNFTSQKRGIEIDGLRRKFYLHYEVGAGADLMLGERLYVKGEVSYPHFPNIRLGLGFLIK